MNQAIRTKISSHKPPRIYASVLGVSKTLEYNQALSPKENHVAAAYGLVDSLMARTAYTRIISALLTESGDEAVHILQLE